MASAPFLDFGVLTKPIPGDNPAGPPVPYDVKEKLEEMRKEIDPETFAADDPMRPEQPKKADWSGIRRVAIDMLANRSKDLLVATRLTEALLKTCGFGGLRDGLQLLHLLVEECWDRLNPPIEDGDLDVRAAPFHWIDVADFGARFPTSVLMVPFIFHKDKDRVVRLNLLDWQLTQKGKGPIPKDALDRAIEATPLDASKNALEDLDQSLENLTKLTTSLNQRMKTSAPGMNILRKAIEDTRFVIAQIVQRKTGSAAPPAGPNGATPAPGQPGSALAPVSGTMSSRADVYRQLAHAAGLLKQLEPHSPIPYLIQRAVELGSLPFPELIKALIRDANVLNELNRELGLRQQEQATPAAE